MQLRFFLVSILGLCLSLSLSAQTPAKLEAQRQEAWDRYYENKLNDAFRIFDQIIKKTANAPADVYYGRGMCEYYRDNLAAAMEDADVLIATTPKLFFGHYLKGIIYDRQGIYGKAFPLLRKAMQIEPDNYHLSKRFGTFCDTHHFYKEAEACALSMQKQWPDSLLPHLILGSVYASTGRSQRGIQLLDSIIRLHPDTYKAYEIRSLARHYNDDQQGCIEDVKHAAQLNPQLGLNYVMISNAYRELGQPELALTYLDSALMEGKAPSLLTNRAFLLADMGRWDEAEAALKQQIELMPNDVLVPNNLAFVYSRQGKFQQAVDVLQPIVRPVALFAFHYNNLAWAKYNIGQKQEALEDIRLSLKLDPSNSYAHYNRARMFLGEKDPLSACEALQSASELEFTARYGPEVDVLMAEHCK